MSLFEFSFPKIENLTLREPVVYRLHLSSTCKLLVFIDITVQCLGSILTHNMSAIQIFFGCCRYRLGIPNICRFNNGPVFPVDVLETQFIPICFFPISAFPTFTCTEACKRPSYIQVIPASHCNQQRCFTIICFPYILIACL